MTEQERVMHAALQEIQYLAGLETSRVAGRVRRRAQLALVKVSELREQEAAEALAKEILL